MKTKQASAYAYQAPPASRSFFLNKVEEIFGLDLRSLALFRFALGCMVIMDVMDRWPDMRAHYSDEGVFPRTSVLTWFWNIHWFSFHMMSGGTTFLTFMFTIHLIAGALLAIGYRTRLMTVVNFILITSLQSRNILVLHGGDVLMKLLCFWSMFLPLEKCWSIDKNMKRDVSKRNVRRLVMSGGTLGLLGQIALMYLNSTYHKTGVEWIPDGTATYLALSLDYFRTWIGDIFLYFPFLCALFTYFTFYWEAYAPLLWFSPIQTQWLKLVATAGFILMHAGFGLAMRLGTFSWVACTGLLALLPSIFWDQFVFKWTRTNARVALRVQYYGDSLLSEKLAKVCSMLLIPETQFVEMKWNGVSSVSAKEDKDAEMGNVGPMSSSVSDTVSDPPTLLKVTDFRGNSWTGYRAVVVVCQYSPLAWPLVWLLGREPVIQFMESNSDVIYSLTSVCCGVDSVEGETVDVMTSSVDAVLAAKQLAPYKRSWKTIKFTAVNTFAVLCLLISITWCLGNVGHPWVTPESLRPLANGLQLEQSWGMFAPRPPDGDWWYVIEGQLESGRDVELWRDGQIHRWNGNWKIDWERPDHFYGSFGNHRWYKFYESLNAHQGQQELRLQYGRYLCREWNSRHVEQDRLYTFKIWFLSEIHNLNGTTTPRPKEMFWHHICYDRQVKNDQRQTVAPAPEEELKQEESLAPEKPQKPIEGEVHVPKADEKDEAAAGKPLQHPDEQEKHSEEEDHERSSKKKHKRSSVEDEEEAEGKKKHLGKKVTPEDEGPVVKHPTNKREKKRHEEPEEDENEK